MTSQEGEGGDDVTENGGNGIGSAEYGTESIAAMFSLSSQEMMSREMLSWEMTSQEMTSLETG